MGGWVGCLGGGGARIGVCSASSAGTLCWWGCEQVVEESRKTEIQNFRAWKSTKVYLVASTKRRSGSKAVARQQG